MNKYMNAQQSSAAKTTLFADAEVAIRTYWARSRDDVEFKLAVADKVAKKLEADRREILRNMP